MKLRIKVTLSTIAIIMASVCCPAQESFEEYLSQFDKRYAIMHDLIFSNPARQEHVSTEVHFSTKERVREIDETVARNIDLLRSKTGLTAIGQVYYRPVSSSVHDTNDPFAGYNSKWQVGIEWNYFQSALYRNDTRIRELRLRGELEQVDFQSSNLQNIIIQQKLATKNHYYGLMMYVLQIHSDNLDLLSRMQVFLLGNGKISSDDLLKVMSEKAEIDNRLTSMKSDPTLSPIPSHPHARPVTVNTEMLKQHISTYHLDIRKLELEKEILQCQYDDIDYWKTTSIYPFINYSYYTRPDISNTHNLDIGISFRLPINTEVRKHRSAIKAEQELKSCYQQDTYELISNEIDAIIRDLDIYNRNITGEYERMKAVREYIRDRNISYRNVAGEYNHIDRLQEYDSFLSSWERMLDFQYQRDCRLIELQGFVTDRAIEEFFDNDPSLYFDRAHDENDNDNENENPSTNSGQAHDDDEN